MTYFGLFAAVSVTKNLAGSVKRILIPNSRGSTKVKGLTCGYVRTFTSFTFNSVKSVRPFTFMQVFGGIFDKAAVFPLPRQKCHLKMLNFFYTYRKHDDFQSEKKI